MKEKRTENIGRCKKVVCTWFILCLFFILSGCTNEDTKKEDKLFSSKDYLDLDYSDLVTINFNKENLELDSVKRRDVTEADIDEAVAYYLNRNLRESLITEGQLEDNQVADIEYTVKQDDRIILGLKDEKARIVVTSEIIEQGIDTSGITGLTKEIKGMKIGSSKTFKSEINDFFSDKSMVGQEVDVTVKLSDIVESRPSSMEEFLKGEGKKYKAESNFRKHLDRKLNAMADFAYKTDRNHKVIDSLISSSSVNEDKIPDKVISYEKDRYDAAFLKIHGADSLEEAKHKSGISSSEYEERREADVKKSVSNKLIIYAMAKKEGIRVSDEDIKAYKADFIKGVALDDEVFKQSFNMSRRDYLKIYDAAYLTIMDKLAESIS